MRKIAVFGLGSMGVGIAENILKAGYELTVYNRSSEKTKPFVDRGARAAATPADAARDADAIVSVVGDDAASRSMWQGADGALSSAPAGCIFVECSTLSLDWIRELDRLAVSKGCHLVDAGLGGGPQVAAAGTIGLFVGADAQVFEKIRPLLLSFSKEQFWFGPTGSGMAFKLINNMMIDIQITGLCEGLALAERAGLNMDVVARAALSGSTSSPIVKMKIDDIRARKYEPVFFALKWMRKDSHYAAKFAGEVKLDMPAASAARSVLDAAADKGLMNKDWIALGEVYR